MHPASIYHSFGQPYSHHPSSPSSQLSNFTDYSFTAEMENAVAGGTFTTESSSPIIETQKKKVWSVKTFKIGDYKVQEKSASTLREWSTKYTHWGRVINESLITYANILIVLWNQQQKDKVMFLSL